MPLHPAEAARIQESKEPLLPPSDIFPAPLKPAEGARVPKALHYVFGLKPVKPGHKPDELPYYAYLAMRSAMINIKPEKTYLCVVSGCSDPQLLPEPADGTLVGPPRA